MFECIIGTRQGCMISPLLFILYVNILIPMCNTSGCSGIYLDELFPSVHALLYADDIGIVNDTVGRLQKQLNVLQLFCGQYGLQVNKTKTNIMVFRNGGTLRQNEKWYFEGTRLETVPYYKYLGINFSSRLSWTPALQTLCSQAQRGIMKIRTVFTSCGDMPIDIGLDLFDKLVLPILLYGCQIWGCAYRDQIEATHIQYCKILLSVSSRTYNNVVLGECGRLPLWTIYMYRCIKFWIKVVNSQGRYIHSCYKNLKVLDDHGKTTWATHIKSLLLTHGYGYVWQQQGVGNPKLFLCGFKQRLQDVARQQWHANIQQCPLQLYREYKTCLEIDTYLLCVEIRVHRIALSRFRSGCNRLAVNRWRGRIVLCILLECL